MKINLNHLLISLFVLFLLLGFGVGTCALQLSAGDVRYQAQKRVTNEQSNQNEKELQQQINFHTAQVKLQILEGILPGTGESVQIPISGTALNSKGNPVSVSGTLTVTFQGGSTPEPIPPVGTSCTGIRDASNGQMVTTAPSGTRLFLQGQNLVKEGTLFTVTIGGERADVLRGVAEVIEFKAPFVPVGKPPVLILYHLISNAWVEKCRLPFTVTAAVGPTPIPPEPPIPIPPEPIPVPPDPNPPLQGENPRIDSITGSGGRVILSGAGFGAATGKVLIDKIPLSVVAWSDRLIEGTGGQQLFVNVVVDLYRPGAGWYTQAWGPLP